MTAVRWVVEHRPDQIGGPDWVEYPDEAAAHAHAGTAGTVRALVTPQYVRVVEAAAAWRAEHARWERDNPYHGASSADVLALVAAVDAVIRPADPIAAIAEEHPLTLRLGEWCCGCGWRAESTHGRIAMADHAAHVHVVADLATEQEPSRTSAGCDTCDRQCTTRCGCPGCTAPPDAPPVDADTNEAGTAGSVDYGPADGAVLHLARPFFYRDPVNDVQLAVTYQGGDGLAFVAVPHREAAAPYEQYGVVLPRDACRDLAHRMLASLRAPTEITLTHANRCSCHDACDRTDLPLDPDATCAHCGQRGAEHAAWRRHHPGGPQ